MNDLQLSVDELLHHMNQPTMMAFSHFLHQNANSNAITNVKEAAYSLSAANTPVARTARATLDVEAVSNRSNSALRKEVQELNKQKKELETLIAYVVQYNAVKIVCLRLAWKHKTKQEAS